MTGWLAALKWLYPGMRVKRWITLGLLGFCFALLGFSLANHGRSLDLLSLPNRFWVWVGNVWGIDNLDGSVVGWSGLAISVGGIALIAYSISRFMHSLTTAVNPGRSGSLVDAVYRNWFLAQGARIVVIGGGTGLSTMLRGLKQYTSNISAVVTVTDDGGSSGRLTRQLNMLPPGDIRNCLVALADSEATMTDLFQYRFRKGPASEGLRDHAFGNLLIAAMCDITDGDFEQAIRLTSQVLNIRGRVLPSTLTHVSLRGEMEDGSILDGETNIAHSPLKVKRVTLCPPDAQTLDEVLEAIELADLIVIGPGSVYTSVVPNLLVSGLAEALHSAKAKKIYICNVMTQPGETDNFTACDHVRAVEAHVPRPIIDYVMVNTAVPSPELMQKYRQSGAALVEPDIDRIRAMGYKALPGNFISQTDVVRHDPAALSEAIMRIMIKTARS
jgi:uncharacterized cofD-like protein